MATHGILATEILRDGDDLKAGKNDRDLLLHLAQDRSEWRR